MSKRLLTFCLAGILTLANACGDDHHDNPKEPNNPSRPGDPSVPGNNPQDDQGSPARPSKPSDNPSTPSGDGSQTSRPSKPNQDVNPSTDPDKNPTEAKGCGDVTEGGICTDNGNSYDYCDNGKLVSVGCDAGFSCQWINDGQYNYFDCMEGGTDLCQKVGFVGICSADKAYVTYCDNGIVYNDFCQDGLSCQFINETIDGVKYEYYGCGTGESGGNDNDSDDETVVTTQACGQDVTELGFCSDNDKKVTYCDHDSHVVVYKTCGEARTCQEIKYDGYDYFDCVDAPQNPVDSDKCQSNNDCAENESCDNSVCKKTDSNVCNPACGENESCINGSCVKACSADADCGENEKCDNGVCKIAESDICKACGENESCIDGSCVKACSADADCGGNELCDNGVCKKAESKVCEADADCAENEKCDNGVCKKAESKACEADADCAENEKCDNGVCKIAESKACEADAGCAENEKCDNGVCKKA